MRILWNSNAPWGHSGYANQTALFVPRLQNLGHHVDIFANWGLAGGIINIDERTRVYPPGIDRHGNDIIVAYAEHCKSDIVITLYDSWVFRPDQMAKVRWCPYLPVDQAPLASAVKDALRSAYQPIAYSQFGFNALREAGFDPRYVPHAVDCKTYKPGDKLEARDKLGQLKDRKDAFIACMVAANTDPHSRKSFVEVLTAWKKFCEGRDALLYMHTFAGGNVSGLNLLEICDALGLSDEQVMFCDQLWYTVGFPDSYMTNVYQAADVLLSPSKGEGFGLPILEAQACGTPVIVGNWTSMPELCFAGWKVEGQPYWTPQGAWMHTPFVSDIVDALLCAYDERDNKAMRKRARDKAVEYDADGVALRYWKPVLDELAAEIAVPDPLEKIKL